MPHMHHDGFRVEPLKRQLWVVRYALYQNWWLRDLFLSIIGVPVDESFP